MKLEEITPLILTYNEEANIERTLGGLRWARQIVVVDSGSVDATVALAERHENVSVGERAFDNHTAPAFSDPAAAAAAWDETKQFLAEHYPVES